MSIFIIITIEIDVINDRKKKLHFFDDIIIYKASTTEVVPLA